MLQSLTVVTFTNCEFSETVIYICLQRVVFFVVCHRQGFVQQRTGNLVMSQPEKTFLEMKIAIRLRMSVQTDQRSWREGSTVCRISLANNSVTTAENVDISYAP